ncbi:growth arrest-specific protein 1-like [Dunckerocampus dactyliophorus]|uniref:growth arrest-specific protein 1-like n=1 Tax=Dunckerocampus dactyliophorus TaxID=161453 RepID=UPI002405E496|nr:growth arrest-specific protein 1-like [Dunckerocampus dactyliophorus]
MEVKPWRRTCKVLLLLVLLFWFCAGAPNRKHRLLCWKATLRCHGEPDCRYAYDQYAHACSPVLNGERRRCPSHCISSLVQLNQTRGGPALEDCDCAADPVCRRTKQAIEPCVTRTHALGCTNARRRCEADRACSASMREYLFRCRMLFGGQRCSAGCRALIARMRDIPAAQQLDSCVCDGAERNICEYIKVSMKTFCSDQAGGRGGAGYAGSGYSEEDSEDDYLEVDRHAQGDTTGGSMCLQSGLVLITMLALTGALAS